MHYWLYRLTQHTNIDQLSVTYRDFPALISGDTMNSPNTHQRGMQPTSAAARYLGLSPSTLNKLRLTGLGPKFIKLGRRVVYDPADLDAWLDSNRRTSTSDHG